MRGTHHFWITEPISNSHAPEVDLHLGSGVVFMDVVRNGRNILSCIRLHRNQENRETVVLNWLGVKTHSNYRPLRLYENKR